MIRFSKRGLIYLLISIAPPLLEELKNSTDAVPQKLNAAEGVWFIILQQKKRISILTSYATAKSADPLPKVTYVDNEDAFRWALLNDEMAFDKLHEGIRKFAADGQTLKDVLKAKLQA